MSAFEEIALVQRLDELDTRACHQLIFRIHKASTV